MGQPNVSLLGENILFTPLLAWFGVKSILWGTPILMAIMAIALKLALDYGFRTQLGLALRATGANPAMARAQGINTDMMVGYGMGLSNGLIALAGAMFAQINGFADVGMGQGTIVFGLAAVIVGETLLPVKTIAGATTAALLGSILYRGVVAIALNTKLLGLQSQDLNLITAVIVALALILPGVRWKYSGRK